MAKKKPKKMIQNINHLQLEEFLNNAEKRYLYKYSAANQFSKTTEDEKLTSQAFLDQYDLWSVEDKEQIEMFLKILRSNIIYSIGPVFSKDSRGEFATFTFDSDNLTLLFKIYGSVDIICLFTSSFIDGAYDQPDYTLEELYQEAIK